MMRAPSTWSSRPRRGMILLVVIALLTLFAVVGLSFVMYANSAATASRLYRESESLNRPDVEPELLFSYFMGQLVYDVPDDERGVYSALRGHSLARSMFGYNDDRDSPGNDVPFNGTGRLSFLNDLPIGPQYDNLAVNYTYFPSDRFLRDPERPGWRGSPRDPRAKFFGGFNAPYTYPDLNNCFLAAVKADGTLMLPSFVREWTGFGPLWINGGPNPNWFDVSNPMLKYLTLRPRPADMGKRFPPPEDPGGDVKNLIGSPGGNDSIWIDLDFPVLTAPDGRKFKPLFAPLVVDLDSRVNLNVHGNIRGRDPLTGKPVHVSNQGWGSWEVNLSQVLNVDSDEHTNLFIRGNPSLMGRYGGQDSPHSGRFPVDHNIAESNLVEGRSSPHFYAPVDFDSSQEANRWPSAQLRLPAPYSFQCFPIMPIGYGNASEAERKDHPKLYNPFQPGLPDRMFALSNMEALLRYGDTGFGSLTSELIRLCPSNFGNPSDPNAVRRRNLVTVQSFDQDRTGVAPWFWPNNNQAQAYLRLRQNELSPSGPALPIPSLSDLANLTALSLRDSEFVGQDGRTRYQMDRDGLQWFDLRRIDLNRYLPDYPAPGENGKIEVTNNEVRARFIGAQRARQYMAAEIFAVLWRATGAGNPALLVSADDPDLNERVNALRWLAQLAVNIVDFIDSDDYSTPFNWYTEPTGKQHWVFGVELPRVILNEAYIERNDTRYDVWVELYNPLFADRSLSDSGSARLDDVYRLLITDHNYQMHDPRNVRGDPDGGRRGGVTSFQPEFVLPSNGRRSDNPGYYVIGPRPIPGSDGSGPELTLTRGGQDEMWFSPPGPVSTHRPSILLRRLACPILPHDDNQLDSRTGQPNPLYNPYITVDYMEDVLPSDGSLAPPFRASIGRMQPYAASTGIRQTTEPLSGGQPRHTFFAANDDHPADRPDLENKPYDWLVHLDRKLINPMELLHVAACKPHELTQLFMTGESSIQRFSHRAPWFDEHIKEEDWSPFVKRSNRLYRALEFFTTSSQMSGMMVALNRHGERLRSRGAVQGGGVNGTVCAFTPEETSGTTLASGSWRIDVGSTLIVDKGKPNEEVVRVLERVDPPRDSSAPAGPAQFKANFLFPHDPRFTILPATISERLPGKININTIWDAETFLALCDPHEQFSSNNFTTDDVTAILDKLNRRTPGGVPGFNDRPFRSLASGLIQYDDVQSGGGLEDSLLFADPDDPRTPDKPSRRAVEVDLLHPYLRAELLTKIFNNITTRSNVFAVWLTVGFFEVTDDSTRPVKLGRELGRAENRHIRHRMFGIVDRSVLTSNPGPQPRFDPRAERSPGVEAPTGRVVPYFSIIE
jgi:hypothetical protein